MKALKMQYLDTITGANTDLRGDGCPFNAQGHVYKFTGESRPTDAWFYDTEEHYKCACGKGYWSAGLFSITKWD